jgi:hypothetical protein
VNGGRKWAYTGLVVGGVFSLVGNVANTVLVDGATSPLFLRIPFAMVWPILTYIGIEVLTRTVWVRGVAHLSARFVLIVPVSMVAAIVSYIHLNHLLKYGGEVATVQVLGPLAIDGLVFGCTVVLLITRPEQIEHAAQIDPSVLSPEIERTEQIERPAQPVLSPATADERNGLVLFERYGQRLPSQRTVASDLGWSAGKVASAAKAYRNLIPSN